MPQVVECPPEPYFDDPQFRNELAVLWDLSFPDKPVADQRERFGWIVERDGRFEVDHIILRSDACHIPVSSIPRAVPTDALGYVHTHPTLTGTIVQPIECENYPLPSELKSGPSTGDVAILAYFERLSGRVLDGIILETDRVYQFSTADPAGTPYPACTYR